MSWTTVLCAAVASACLTLAAMHTVVWAQHRRAKAHLAFAILSIGVAAFTWSCLYMMRARTTSEFAIALWWTNVTVLWLVAAMVGFVRVYFRTARPWLGHLAWALRALAMTAHAVRFPNSDFDVITGLVPVSFLGDRVSVAEGVTSVWLQVGQLSLFTLLCFVVDATISAWRRGTADERRRALVIGLPSAAFVGGGATSAALIFSGVVDWPHVEFIPSLGVLCVMGYSLSADVLRAARLSEELTVSEASLRASEQRMTMAAEAARELSGRLINAQEDERRRIARDLHDDFNQRLSLLSVELELLGRGQSEPALTGLAQIATKIRHLSSEVHKLSHQLHPAKLEQLGLETALRSWCADVSRQTPVAVEFSASAVPVNVPADSGLCLYRIAQEALRNVVRHSGTTSCRVELTAGDGVLRLVVSDSGRGFDAVTAPPSSGLGLLSMRERAHLARGIFEVDSSPGQGTRIVVTVPFPRASPAPRSVSHSQPSAALGA